MHYKMNAKGLKSNDVHAKQVELVGVTDTTTQFGGQLATRDAGIVGAASVATNTTASVTAILTITGNVCHYLLHSFSFSRQASSLALSVWGHLGDPCCPFFRICPEPCAPACLFLCPLPLRWAPKAQTQYQRLHHALHMQHITMDFWIVMLLLHDASDSSKHIHHIYREVWML